jgi:hypothetical protein
MPKWLASMIDERFNAVLMVVGLLTLLIVFFELRGEKKKNSNLHDSPARVEQSTTTNLGNATATATGNKIEQHFYGHQYDLDDIAEAVTGRLKKEGGGIIDSSEKVGVNTSSRRSASGGFVQFERRSIAIDSEENVERIVAGDLQVGEVIKLKFEYANRGSRPVFDNQSWGLIVIVDPAKNPGARLREVMLNGIKAGYENFKNFGNELGVGIKGHNFAQSTPLTQEELEGLKQGTLRVHIMLGGGWTDENGERFYWTRAEWTNWPQVPIEQSFWKDA